ncbi:hypothetical protein I4U23_011721 [Adineta vaga]|nr:hypothetical protein I4U23_011721 [Adineta vaga]
MSFLSTNGTDEKLDDSIELSESIFTIETENPSDKNVIPMGIHVYCDAEQTTFEEVAGICLNKDDRTMKSLTIRSFTIGFLFICFMSFYHMWYYVTKLYALITPVTVILISHLMAKIWSRINGVSWTMKEHTIVLLMTNVAWTFSVVYDISVISYLEYQERIPSFQFIYMFFFVVSIQFLGFGLAGILRRFLVWPSSEVWPSNFPSIALLRILHPSEISANRSVFGDETHLSLWQRFLSNELRFYFIIVIAQFIFYWLPGYMIPVLSGFSWICMIKPTDYTLAQLTDYRGLSLGSFSLNWYSITYFLESPFVVPRWALVNIGVGFVLVAWIITPIIYFQNVWKTREHAISSSTQSSSNWSAMGFVTTFTTFASLSAVFVHTFLHHGKNLWQQIKYRSLDKKGNDTHCRLIELYPDVPDWWFLIVSVVAVVVIMIVAHVSNLLEWYNVLFALSIAMIFVLPYGMVTSITGQLIQNQAVYFLMVIIVGLLWAGNQSKRMTFIAIGYTTYCQTLYLVSNMKLGHYMKIPPRILFLVQLIACLVCSSFGAGIQYYFYAVKRYYEHPDAYKFESMFDLTNVGSTIVNNTSFITSQMPQNRIFFWSLLIGALLPIPFWFASRKYKWCHLVHIPLMLATVSWMPLVDTGTMLTWLIIGFSAVILVRRECWKRHIYLTSSALDAGMAFALAMIGGPLVYYNVTFPSWWGDGGESKTGCPFSQINAALAQSFDPETYGT